MSDLKVDLSSIKALYPENLIGAETVLDRSSLAGIYRGTDLKFDERKGELTLTINGKSQKVDLAKEAAYLQMIREADANKDNKLDLIETQKLLQSQFSNLEIKQIDPEQFLKAIQTLIESRYRPWAKNMITLQARLKYLPTLEALKIYNEGIYKDEVRQAKSVLPLNGLTKSVLNIPSWIGYNLIVRPGSHLLRIIPGLKQAIPQPIATWFPMDHLAARMAQSRLDKRTAALSELENTLKMGIEKGESWVQDGKWDELLKRLSPKTRAVFLHNIPSGTIHKIFNESDVRLRAQALKNFAAGERPGVFGYGGGNASSVRTANLFNYTGRHNNLYFARSSLAFLGNKQVDPTGMLRKDVNLLRRDIMGDSGGFANVAAVMLTGAICGTGYVLAAGNRLFKTCKPTPYRSWGDEGRMDFVGRFIHAGVSIFGAHKGFQAWKEAWGLRRFEGLRGVGRVWKSDAAWSRPVPIQAMRKAKEAAEARLAEMGTEAIATKGWFSQRMSAWKEKMFKNLPPLPESQRKAIDAMSRARNKTMDRLVEGVLILGVTQASDKRMQAPYNPFDTKHDMEAGPYPNVLEKPALPPTVPSKPGPVKTNPLRLPLGQGRGKRVPGILQLPVPGSPSTTPKKVNP